MSEQRQNPFPGLRPFMFHEHELFFGREEQYEQMVGKLATTRFLSVVGSSGSGKSSLVRAGLLPALYGGKMSAGPDWRVAVFRPKDDPIRELAQALNHQRVFGARFNENGSSLLSIGDIIDWPALCSSLSNDAKKSEPGPGNRILNLLPPDMQHMISHITGKVKLKRKPDFLAALNVILKGRGFYDERDFAKVDIPSEAQKLLARGEDELSESEIMRLNRLLLEAAYPREIARASEMQTRITEVSLRRGDLGLIEAVRQAKMLPHENLLIVVDQFEELFSYARISEHGHYGNNAAAFVKLLLEAKRQEKIPIYVVLTMRSDYLGDCAKFSELPEAINEGQYLTPRLTLDQLREAIIGPIKAYDASITPQLVNQLINEMGDSQDQLPILQHALMRTWDKWEKEHQENEPIDVPHYEAIGRMAHALSLHADEALNELPDERSREIAEKVFKCLTERGSRSREIRRPTALEEISDITRVGIEEIVPVINVFRQEGRSFLMPSPRKTLARHTSIDISHESLIRNWTKLKEWVQEEARAANAYRRLVETARLYDAHKASILSELEVEYALKWREDNHPNLAWASRYHHDLYEDAKKSSPGLNTELDKIEQDDKIFKHAMAFLEESQRTRSQEKEDEKRRSRAQLKRTRIFAAVLLALFLGCLVSLVLSLHFQKRARENENITNLLTYIVNIGNAQKAFADNNYATAYSYLDILRDPKYQQMYGFEWDYLTKVSAQEIRINPMQHTTPVTSAAFLSDMTTLATASDDGEIMFWDRNTQKKKDFDIPDSARKLGPSSIRAFSPNGKFMAMVNNSGESGHSRDTITVYDFTTKANPNLLKDSKDNLVVQSLAFSPDGTKLAGVLAQTTGDGSKEVSPSVIEKIIVWDMSTSHEQELLSAGSAAIHFTAIAFSENNQHVAVGYSDGRVSLCDVASPTFKCSQISLEGDTATSGGQDMSAQGAIKTSVQALAYSPDQKMLAVGFKSGIVYLWDVENEKPSNRLANTDTISAVAFSPDGKSFAASGYKGSVRLWPLDASNQAMSQPQNGILAPVVLKGHAGAVLSMTFLPGSSILATTSDDKTIKLWDISRREVMEKQYPAPLAGFLELPPDATVGGERFAVQLGDSARTLGFEKKTGEGFTSFKDEFQDVSPGDFENIASTAYSPTLKNRLLSVFRLENGAAKVKLWDLKVMKPLGREWNISVPKIDKGTFDQIKSMSASMFSTDGNRLAIWSPQIGIIQYNLVTGAESRKPLTKDSKEITLPSKDSRSSIFSPDLSMFVKIEGQYLQVFNASTGNWIRQVDCAAPAYAIVFSPDGKRLAAGLANKTVRLWNTPSWKWIDDLKGHDSYVQAVAFSPDSKRLASGSSSGEIKLWDINLEHWDMRQSLWDKLRVWELMTISPKEPDSGIMMLNFSPNGKVLIARDIKNKVMMLGGN